MTEDNVVQLKFEGVEDDSPRHEDNPEEGTNMTQDVPEMPEDIPMEMYLAMFAAQEIASQVFGGDFMYSLGPNTAAGHIEMTVKSLINHQVNLTVALPVTMQHLAMFRRSCVSIAHMLYVKESEWVEAQQKLIVPDKKLIVPGRD